VLRGAACLQYSMSSLQAVAAFTPSSNPPQTPKPHPRRPSCAEAMAHEYFLNLRVEFGIPEATTDDYDSDGEAAASEAAAAAPEASAGAVVGMFLDAALPTAAGGGGGGGADEKQLRAGCRQQQEADGKLGVIAEGGRAAGGDESSLEMEVDGQGDGSGMGRSFEGRFGLPNAKRARQGLAGGQQQQQQQQQQQGEVGQDLCPQTSFCTGLRG